MIAAYTMSVQCCVSVNELKKFSFEAINWLKKISTHPNATAYSTLGNQRDYTLSEMLQNFNVIQRPGDFSLQTHGLEELMVKNKTSLIT